MKGNLNKNVLSIGSYICIHLLHYIIIAVLSTLTQSNINRQNDIPKDAVHKVTVFTYIAIACVLTVVNAIYGKIFKGEFLWFSRFFTLLQMFYDESSHRHSLLKEAATVNVSMNSHYLFQL